MTSKLKACLITMSALAMLTSCQGINAKASSCAGWTRNSLSPAGTVALIQADRPGFDRVAGNDRNYDRICKK